MPLEHSSSSSAGATPSAETTPPSISRSEVVFAADALGTAEVTVVIPLFDGARYVTDALKVVKGRTVQPHRPGHGG